MQIKFKRIAGLCIVVLGCVISALNMVDEASGLPSEADKKIIMERHNFYRAEVGVPDLKWSNELAKVASTWATTLQQDNCGFYHSQTPYGENLWKGTTGYFTVADAINSWGSEKKDYNYKRNSCKGVCGHYTQIVWKNTTHVGCASVTCDGNTIWVCSYDPPGNYIGQKPF